MSSVSVLQLIYGLLILLATVVGLLIFALAFGVASNLLRRFREDKPETIAVDHLPSGVLVFDHSNRIYITNQAIASFLNCSQESLIGITREEFLARFPVLNPITEPDYPSHKPIMIHHRYLEVLQHNASFDEATGFIWIFRDVTERITTERVLRVNEQRYRALFDNSNDAIFIINLDSYIEFANEQAAILLGTELDELLGAHTDKYLKKEEIEKSQVRFDMLMAGEHIPIYERIFRRADGVEVPCEITPMVVRDTDGTPMHIQTIVRDITERKRHEEELKARLEQLDIMHHMDEEISSTLSMETVAIIGLDASLRLSGADAGFIAVAEGEEVRVRHYIGQYPTNAYGHSLRHDIGVAGRILVNQEPELVMDVELDPDYFPDIATTEALMGLPLISQEHLVGVLILETKRRDAFTEQRFKSMKILANRIATAMDNARLYDYARGQLSKVQGLYDELKALESLKTDIIRIASHDLKNPLSVIKGYVELMRFDGDKVDEEHQGFLEDISKSIARMQGILDDILSLERLNDQMIFEPINLRKMIERAFKEYRSQATLKQQTFTLDLCDDDIIINGNETQFYEAISNLIGNAIKYTPDEGTIHVRLDGDSDGITFKVEDNGYGIPIERQERLFQPFYRALTMGTEHIEGTGLGLYLVKSIIERHSGAMFYESIEGEGSTFGFTMEKEAIRKPSDS